MNVDLINYIYCNSKTFISNTGDAIKKLAEQLGPINKMAEKDRLTLNMILLEKRWYLLYDRNSMLYYYTEKYYPCWHNY